MKNATQLNFYLPNDLKPDFEALGRLHYGEKFRARGRQGNVSDLVRAALLLLMASDEPLQKRAISKAESVKRLGAQTLEEFRRELRAGAAALAATPADAEIVARADREADRRGKRGKSRPRRPAG